MGAQGLNAAHNVVDISVAHEDAGVLYDHLQQDHGWKQTDVITGSELLMLHFRTHHEAVVAGSHMLGQHDAASARTHKLANALRYAADNPATSRQPRLWTEGFCDGLRFSAALADLCADDRLTMENLSEALDNMFARRF